MQYRVIKVYAERVHTEVVYDAEEARSLLMAVATDVDCRFASLEEVETVRHDPMFSGRRGGGNWGTRA